MATRTRRLDGEGSIRQRPDGRWEVRLRAGGRRITRYAHDQAGALAVLHGLRGQQTTGTLTPPSSLTLGVYLADWLAAHSPALRPSTVESYRQLCGHVAPLAHLRLSRLEPRHLAALYGQKRRDGLSAGRVRKLHAMLRKSLGDAVRWGLLPRNIAAAVDPPRPEERHSPLWTLDQVRAFLAVCKGDDRPDARLLAFLLLSGLRLGEALALDWNAINLDAGAVAIERGLTHVEGKPVEGPPKTKAGVRTIALPSEAVALLHRQRATQAARRLAAGPGWPGGERVWTTAVGTAPLRGNVRRSLHALCHRAGLSVIRVHDLRHLHATLLVAGGVDPKTAQRRLGHASLQMTLQVYARALPEADRRAVEALGRALNW
jgi:integrase